MHVTSVFFVCLLFMLASKGETTNTNSSDQLVFQHFHAAQIHKHNVFLSFRGLDIRDGFLAHLIEALSQKNITFFVDDKIIKGDEIAESLVEAIETSSISLVIFSENYASSSWCLDEIVKIVECREEKGQVLLPVFYKVDPTIVRHQNGTYVIEFAEHEKKYSSSRVQRWRSALKKSSAISGFHSSNYVNEAELIKEIVKNVLKRLDHVRQFSSKQLVGVGKQISRVESLLEEDSQNVRVIGIWGVHGIGKTTIAHVIYDRLYSEYDGSYFKAEVRKEWGTHGDVYLKKDLLSNVLGKKDLKIDTQYGLPYFVERRLRRMKVLIVLDDVNDPHQLETLIGNLDLYGKGSKIIITTDDKQVLTKMVAAKDIYYVKPLDTNDSLSLFSLHAFEQNQTYEMEYYELSKMIVKYANGIPLVLKILGQHLHGQDKSIWKKKLKTLKKAPIKYVHDIIKLNYNDLDRHEQMIFLDIACFFDGLHLKVDDLNLLLNDGGYSIGFELEKLKNKDLITISPDDVVSMHNIIQESAWQIVREESNYDVGHQSHLLDPSDIYEVLENNKGTNAIRSISTELSIIDDLKINPKVFSKMNRLQYLDIKSKGYNFYVFLQFPLNLYLPQGLESLPNDLKYLRWSYYPLESLPFKFTAEKLVVLNLQYSQVRKLWHEEKDVMNLKDLILSSSLNLVELPDLSKAKNLATIDLRACVRLTSIHPSVFSLNKLEKLDLSECFSLTNLKSNIHSSSIRYLSLAGCTALEEFSVTSKEMVILNLEFTGIRKLPSSIGLQKKLEKLILSHTYIENLPKSIKHLSMLRHLELQNCSNLQSLPRLPSSLITLDVSGCVTLEDVTFPSISLQMSKENKTRVAFWNCLKLDQHSLKEIELNAQINMIKLAHKQISTSGDEHDYDAQGTYVYPGSSVPKWMIYRTKSDSMIVDLSFVNHSSDQLAFIFCFIIPQIKSRGSILRFNISVDSEDENIQLYFDRPSLGIKSDHVYLTYDQGLSRYLNSRLKNHSNFKIKVTMESGTPISGYMVEMLLRGVGVSPLNSSQYLNFIQHMEIITEGPIYLQSRVVHILFTICIGLVIGFLCY
ncbi:putative disease resistance protein At4g11170 [Vicia villosa]|uniref:putative disease resistance protein At4g11170 n=1 Tax=Vicia villosa TaxID=3911 RepID=UPI00273B98CD|nr:putative disease resistance protein At4g11170 [Vicia villosa]